MKTREILIAAKAKIEQGWTKGTWARDRNDTPVFPNESCAVSWCSLGAIQVVARGQGSVVCGAAENQLMDLVPSGFDGSISKFNDHPSTTKEDVLRLFDKAITHCQE